MRNETALAMVLFASCLFTIAVTMMFTDAPRYHEYNVSVTSDGGVMLYEVETWDGKRLGVVTASQLDSLIIYSNK